MLIISGYIVDLLKLHNMMLLQYIISVFMRLKLEHPIHGKGKGVLKKRVHGLLRDMPFVKSFKDAPHDAGSWGATLVELSRFS